MLIKMNLLKAITFYFTVIAVVAVADNCRPAEEGTSHNISCSFNVTAVRSPFHLNWTAIINNTVSWVATCSIGKCDTLPGFKAEVINNEVILTIGKVSRTDPFNAETQWRCEDRPVCNPLQVYARPKDLTCEFPPFNTSSYMIPMVCSTDGVYPEAYYQVNTSTDKVLFKEVIHKTRCSNSPRNDTPVYYKSECALSLPLSSFRTGDNYIKVKIFPKVSKGELFASVDSDVYQVTLDLRHGGSMPEASPSLYLAIGLGAVIVITLCAVVVLGVKMLALRRKFQRLERSTKGTATKQVPKEVPAGYSALHKKSMDEDGEMYEDVRSPAQRSRPGVPLPPVSSDNIYGNS